MRRLVLALAALAALLYSGVAPSPSHADCRALAPPGSSTYASGTMRDHLCDADGNLLVSLGAGTAGGLGTVVSTPPTLTPGAGTGFYFDEAGNAFVTFGTLLSGEDQTNNLIQTSGGAVRLTTFSSVTSATSSAITTVPTGAKTFMGQIINATSETKALTVGIYGNWTSSTTGGILLCTLTMPSTVTVLQLQDVCPVVTANFAFYYYTVSAYTSASSAPFTVYAMY